MGTALLIIVLSLTQVQCQLFDRLYSNLMRDYLSDTIPLKYRQSPLNVSLGLSLIKVNSINTETGDASIDGWLFYEWKDERLRWSKRKYNNIGSQHIHPSKLWTPDIVPYNGQMQSSDNLAILYNTGVINLIPQTSFSFRCDLFDYQSDDTVTCMFKLGSWSYDGSFINLVNRSESVDLGNFRQDRWEVVSISLNRNVVYYSCCPEQYIDITFYMVFRDTKKKRGWTFF